MKNKNILKVLNGVSQLFAYKNVTDSRGREFVLLAGSAAEDLDRVEDKTQFEAVDSHVHLLEGITKKQLPAALDAAKTLGRAMLDSLNSRFPDKEFTVYATVSLHDSLILRFHQQWPDEAPYYDPAGFAGTDQYIFAFRTWEKE